MLCTINLCPIKLKPIQCFGYTILWISKPIIKASKQIHYKGKQRIRKGKRMIKKTPLHRSFKQRRGVNNKNYPMK